jgi:hypothetical protein
MAATMEAMANRTIISNILEQLSDMKYKDRQQNGPDQPVQFLEFRPTLVPSILVNKLWADEGTSILWKRYPHLPALDTMEQTRRQYYADKIQRIFSMGPSPEGPMGLDYLDDLVWPNLKSLELELDLQKHGAKFASMMHPGLEHLEISGVQSGGSAHFVDVVFPSLLVRNHWFSLHLDKVKTLAIFWMLMLFSRPHVRTSRAFDSHLKLRRIMIFSTQVTLWHS